MKHFAPFALFALAIVAPLGAHAQVRSAGHAEHSPERVAIELRLGPYRPPLNPELGLAMGNDRGPLVAGEVDVWALRIPYLGLLGGGAGFGWAKYSNKACLNADCTSRGEESTSLKLYPLYAVAVLRIDALARHARVPFVFSGKLGVEYTRFRIDDPMQSSNGGAIGLRWGAQIALELDVFDRTAANRLDAEWGINHSYVFFEMFGSTSKNGDFDVSDSFAWVAGLGLIL